MKSILAFVIAICLGTNCYCSNIAFQKACKINFVSRDILKNGKIEVYISPQQFGGYGNEVIKSDDIYKSVIDVGSKKIDFLIHNGTATIRLSNVNIGNRIVLVFRNDAGKQIKSIGALRLVDNIPITIKEDNGEFIFVGNANKRYQFEAKIDQMAMPSISLDKIQIRSIRQYFNSIDSVVKQQLVVFREFCNYSTKREQDLIYADIIINSQSRKDLIAEQATSDFIDSNKVKVARLELLKYNNPIWNQEIKTSLLKNKHFRHNLDFLRFLDRDYHYQYCFIAGHKFDISQLYLYVNQTFFGPVREWMVTYLVANYINYGNDAGNVGYAVNDALKTGIKNNSIRKYLQFMAHSDIPGQRAINFSLPDTSGKIHHLSDFKGKIVLLDFYFESCGACREIHPYLDSIKIAMKGRNFQLITVFWDTRRIPDQEWLEIIHTNTMTNAQTLNLLAQRSSDGKDPLLITALGSSVGGSTLVYIDKNGNYMQRPMSPRIDGGKAALKFIENNL